jgi:hypothetical protein
MLTLQQGKQWYQVANLSISHLSPLIIYFAIRPHVASDTEALALAWFVPVVWTLGSSLWWRRLNFFGLLGVAVYGIALAIAIFFHAGALPLKLRHAVVAGALGLVCLGSLVRGKPLFLFVIRRSVKNTRYAGQVDAAIARPELARRISNVTLVIGIVFLADAVLQTALALLLSTGAFLIATTAVHIGVIVGTALGMAVFFWIKSNR